MTTSIPRAVAPVAPLALTVILPAPLIEKFPPTVLALKPSADAKPPVATAVTFKVAAVLLRKSCESLLTLIPTADAFAKAPPLARTEILPKILVMFPVTVPMTMPAADGLTVPVAIALTFRIPTLVTFPVSLLPMLAIPAARNEFPVPPPTALTESLAKVVFSMFPMKVFTPVVIEMPTAETFPVVMPPVPSALTLRGLALTITPFN